jgi:hypothetical protein
MEGIFNAGLLNTVQKYLEIGGSRFTSEARRGRRNTNAVNAENY